MSRYIIGVHSGHDASACLIRDNKIIYAIEKERITRKKHDSGEPIECIEYLLEAEGISHNDIDLVVRCNWFDGKNLDDEYYKKFKKVLVNYNHHLFHAYAVSLLEQKENMLIMIFDGRGCRPEDAGYTKKEGYFESESVYYSKESKIETLEKRYALHEKSKYPWGSSLDSIGYAYAHVSRIIFSDFNAAGKVMALASYGRKNKNIPRPVIYDSEKNMKINNQWTNYLQTLGTNLDYNSDIAKDLSYSIQESLEEYINYRIMNTVSKYNCKNIGLSGGVALNCKNNGVIANKKIVENLNLFPACGDNGLSIGAAVWAVRNIYKDYGEIEWSYSLGKTYSKTQIKNGYIDSIVNNLYNNNIIGLFENGSEYGPRALCNRSIIANPSDLSTRERLNKYIKERELFRPFGGVVLERNISKITEDTIPSDFMLSAIHLNEKCKKEYPALLHIDGTTRMQVVRDQTSLIYKVLDQLEKKYGQILLINTSFNSRGEPIVETEKEAKSCAEKIGLDFLYISGEEYTLKK